MHVFLAPSGGVLGQEFQRQEKARRNAELSARIALIRKPPVPIALRVAEQKEVVSNLIPIRPKKREKIVVYDDIFKEEREAARVTSDKILFETCRYFNIDAPRDLIGHWRERNLIMPRHIATYLMREMTLLSLPQIGKRLNRDHSTVKFAIDKVRKLISSGDVTTLEAVRIIKKAVEGKNG